MKLVYWLGIAKLYMTRGQSVYFALPLSILNTSILIYNFIFKHLTWVPDQFKHYWLFLIVFLLVLLPLAIIVGMWDMKRGLYVHEHGKAMTLSPIWKKVFKELKEIKDVSYCRHCKQSRRKSRQS